MAIVGFRKPTIENDINVADYLWIAQKIAYRFTRERPIKDTIEYADGCLGLCKAKRRYDPTVGSFEPLAYTSVRRTILDSRRRRRERAIGTYSKRERSFDTMPEVPDYRHRPEPFQDEVDKAVTIAKQTLSHNDFQLLLRQCYGKNRSEIENEFGLSREAVRQAIVRIHVRLGRRQLLFK